MNEQVFIESMTFLKTYYGRTLESHVQQMYWSMLKKLTDEQFRTACGEIVKKFHPTATTPFPLIVNFLEVIGESDDIKAENIIAVVRNAAERIDRYKSVDFGCRALHAVINRFGGWPEICNWKNDEWQFNGRNFVGAYKAALAYGREDGPDRVLGLMELENSHLPESAISDKTRKNMLPALAYQAEAPRLSYSGIKKPEIEDKTKIQSVAEIMQNINIDIED